MTAAKGFDEQRSRQSLRRLAMIATTAAAITGIVPPLFGVYSRYSDFDEQIEQAVRAIVERLQSQLGARLRG